MYIGIDLGGTNIAAAIVEADGKITKRVSIPTDKSEGARTISRGLLSVCETLLAAEAEAPLSIGIGVPGSVSDETGEVIFTPNLPLRGENITRDLQMVYDCPIRLGNDANCAALGEIIAGGAKGAKNVVFVTLGTGVGGGIIQNGSLLTGLSGAASELGHMVILEGGRECGCGRRGCWESYASATGLIITAKELMTAHNDSMLWKLCGGNASKINGSLIFEAYRAGDEAACSAVESYVKHLAAGIVNVINVIDPEMICVGGGISNEWDSLSGALFDIVEAEQYYRYKTQAPRTRIVRAELGNDAGIIGAAMLGVET